MEIRVDINRAGFDELLRLRPKALAIAWDRSKRDAAKALRRALVTQWRRDMYVTKRKGFPDQVLRTTAKSSPHTPTSVNLRDARVYNKFADNALRAQIKGATRRRTPSAKSKSVLSGQNPKRLYVPQVRRKPLPRAEKNRFVRGNRVYRWAYKKETFIGVRAKTVTTSAIYRWKRPCRSLTGVWRDS